MTAATLDAPTLDRLRTRTVRTLMASVALGSTGHIAAVTVATVAAAELTESDAWSGVPGRVRGPGGGQRARRCFRG